MSGESTTPATSKTVKVTMPVVTEGYLRRPESRLEDRRKPQRSQVSKERDPTMQRTVA
jgi:hypothetical protein